MTREFGPWSDGSGLPLAAAVVLFGGALLLIPLGLYLASG